MGFEIDLEIDDDHIIVTLKQQDESGGAFAIAAGYLALSDLRAALAKQPEEC
jgi:hypothetical protein